MAHVENAPSESRRIVRQFSSSLAQITAVESDPGYTSLRSTCPDGQFWLPVRGEQVVQGAYGNRRQRPFDLLYYAPREPAQRMADSPTFAYGVRVRLSHMNAEEHDASWLDNPSMQWTAVKAMIGVVALGLNDRVDPMEVDEAVARWVRPRKKQRHETPRAPWIRKVEALIYDDPSLTLTELSQAVGVVPSYMSAEFSRVQRFTISAYRRQVMLQRALRLSQEFTLNEAAIEAGFYDASHFHRVCQAELSLKPSSLRQLIWPT